jgi:hypothetical protein
VAAPAAPADAEALTASVQLRPGFQELSHEDRRQKEVEATGDPARPWADVFQDWSRTSQTLARAQLIKDELLFALPWSLDAQGTSFSPSADGDVRNAPCRL